MRSHDNPYSVWQIDTDEVGDVESVFAYHLAGIKNPDTFSDRLGMLWKKLGGAPRLAHLLGVYVEMKVGRKRAANEALERGEVRFLDRLRTAMGRPPRPVVSRRVDLRSEDDPLYDRWVDS